MTTWRERIVEARARGGFSNEDRILAGCSGSPYAYDHCAVGEQADKYGAELFFRTPMARCGVLDAVMYADGGAFAGAVQFNQFDVADTLLESIEDRALELKREAQP